jgi:hypothetical protein
VWVGVLLVLFLCRFGSVCVGHFVHPSKWEKGVEQSQNALVIVV